MSEKETVEKKKNPSSLGAEKLRQKKCHPFHLRLPVASSEAAHRGGLHPEPGCAGDGHQQGSFGEVAHALSPRRGGGAEGPNAVSGSKPAARGGPRLTDI